MNRRKRAAASAAHKRFGGAEALKSTGFMPDDLRPIKGSARGPGEAGRMERGENL